jgi:predicted DNA-binding transcriptional regulator AlpA
VADPGALLEGAPPTLNRAQLKRYLAISDKTLWTWTHDLGFPRPAFLTTCASRWRTADVVAWLRAQGQRREEVANA